MPAASAGPCTWFLWLFQRAKCVAQAHSEGSWAQALCFGLAGERGQEVAVSASRWWLLGSALLAGMPADPVPQLIQHSSYFTGEARAGDTPDRFVPNLAFSKLQRCPLRALQVPSEPAEFSWFTWPEASLATCSLLIWLVGRGGALRRRWGH